MDGEGEYDTEDVIAVSIVVASAVVVLVGCVFCCVVPGCWCYNRICSSNKERRTSTSDETIILEIPRKKRSVKLKENPSPFYQSVGAQLDITEPKDRPGTFISNQVLPYTFPTYPTTPPTPKFNLKIQFSPNSDAAAQGQLTIHVIGVENVPPRDYPTLPDSFAKLSVLHRVGTLSTREKQLHELQTQVIKDANCPLLSQRFTLPATLSEIKSWCLRIGVWDDDKLTRTRETCHGRLSLKDITSSFSNSDPPRLSISLDLTPADRGQVLVSISYLPTAQRLSVNVAKASELHWQNVSYSLLIFRAHVRVSLMDHGGRLVKKKKLSGTPGTDSPTFTGTALFLAPPIVLETASVLIQIYNETNGRGSVEEAEEGADKRKVVGYTALGWFARDTAGREQWRTLLTNPRKVISHWHQLR